MRGAILFLAFLSACGGENVAARAEPTATPAAGHAPSASPSEVESTPAQQAEPTDQASEPPGEPIEPSSPTPVVRAPPSPAEFERARQTCSSAFAELRRGTVDGPRRAIDEAVEVLGRANESPSQRRVLGACLYNQGRALEEFLDIDSARFAYEMSLEARPNRVVAERLRRLGTREVNVMPDPLAGIVRQLARAADHPCGERRAECETRGLMYTHSGGGPLLRAAVLAVSERDEDVMSLYLAWAGAQGPFRWGPRIGAREDMNAEGLIMDEPMGWIAFRPMVEGEPWHLFVRYDLDWIEECCGGRNEGHNRDLVVCELKGEARCVFVAESRYCEGEGTVEGFEFLECEQDDTQQVVVGTDGLTLSGARPDNSRRFVRPGTHSWAELFPPRRSP